MDITPMVKVGQKIIQGYVDGGFKVSGERYDGAVCVEPDALGAWNVDSFEALCREDFQFLIDRAADIDVVLLGCGARMQFLPRDLKADLSARGLVVDVMDTGAACRTYNVLVADGRRVVALMFPI